MPPALLPETVHASLVQLRDMLQRFWADELQGRRLPLAFWKIEDDAIFYDALQYLPGCMLVHGGRGGSGHDHRDLRQLPPGFWTAVAVFELEDGFATDGWTAVSNLGPERLQDVLEAYRAIGLHARAAALSRVIEALRLDPDDEDSQAQAAAGELPDLIDDDAASAKVMAHLREDADEKFGLVPSDWV